MFVRTLEMYSVVQYMFVAGNYMNSNYMFIKDQSVFQVYHDILILKYLVVCYLGGVIQGLTGQL